MKKVSIVLPVYNGQNRVSKAIESIITQTYSNFELIIVNDCSTDNTLEVLKRYAELDNRIIIFTNDTNQKLPRSLNVGFSKASGDYWTWTSDDNAYKPEAISEMVKHLEENGDIDMVYSDFDIVELDGTYKDTRRTLEPDAIRYENAVGACFLYRKELAKKIGGYDPDLFLAEDYEYWIKAYLNGKLQHISEVLYLYGWHDESLTVTKERQVYQKTYEAKDKHFDELIARCKTQEERNEFYWRMLRLIIDEAEKNKVRDKYYRLDKDFKRADKKRIWHDRIQRGFIGRIICINLKL